MFRPFIAILALSLATPALAQSERPASEAAAQVHFPAGASGVTLQGAVRGNDFFDYALGARAGQTMSVDLSVADTNGDGTIYFNIMPPGATYEVIYLGQNEGNSARVELPEDGDYVIRIYLMGNDRDTDKTVGYNLDVAIE